MAPAYSGDLVGLGMFGYAALDIWGGLGNSRGPGLAQASIDPRVFALLSGASIRNSVVRYAGRAYRVIESGSTLVANDLVALSRTVLGRTQSTFDYAILEAGGSFRLPDGQVFELLKDGRLARTEFAITPLDVAAARQFGRGWEPFTTELGNLGLATDVGGHLRASRFFGQNFYPNILPQSGLLNNKAFSELESLLTRAVEAGNEVRVSIDLTYRSGSRFFRPDSFRVGVTIDNGRRILTTLANRNEPLDSIFVRRLVSRAGLDF